jgi:triphosphoribosyl-dephospho-CoA synthase
VTLALCRPTRAELAQVLRFACELDVNSLKPGNVSVDSAGHGMEASDFLRCAQAIAEPLTAPNLCVGARILAAIESTQRVVDCNTNLGIVLLASVLIHAALANTGEPLRASVAQVLADLNIQDASLAYRAIRLAKPGGMGASERHDISAEPTVNLYVAMQEAALRDSIARQYATGYRDIFELGAKRFRAARAAYGSPGWAATVTFLEWLSRFPDSLIVRKYGLARAQEISRVAAGWHDRLGRLVHPEALIGELQAWDRALKETGINPGTSADLTVASVLTVLLEDLLHRPAGD